MLCIGAEDGSERARQLACARVAVTAHLVAQIGEAHAVIGIGERELAARPGVPETPERNHWLGRR